MASLGWLIHPTQNPSLALFVGHKLSIAWKTLQLPQLPEVLSTDYIHVLASSAPEGDTIAEN